MKFETIAIHAGGQTDGETGALAPPIHLSTTFEMGADGGSPTGFHYIRETNPTEFRLEAALTAIEGGASSLVFSSGMAAGAAFAQALPAGSHLLLPDDSYYGYRVMARDFLSKWGLTFDIVAMEDLEAVRSAVRSRKTSVLWAESPSNPLLKIVDLEALGTIAREAGATYLVDGTFATPALQRPLDLGADIVLHSTTKNLGGHSDVQGGALVFRQQNELHEAVRHARHIMGAVASPFNSWLVLRGIRSLSARMRFHCDSAARIAEHLSRHPSLHAVHYPGLPSHPRHDIAARQMSAFGGMLSFQVKGGREAALEVTAGTRLFTRATSLGGVESLIEHRHSSEGKGSTAPVDLVRLSIGLEHPDDLIADLEEALAV